MSSTLNTNSDAHQPEAHQSEASRSEPPSPAFFADAMVMTMRSLKVVARTPAAIVSALFLPLILMLVMTASFAKVVTPDGTYADYVNLVMPLFAVMGLMFSSITTGVSAFGDIQSGMDDRLRTLPIGRSASLWGRVLGDTLRNCVTLVVLGCVGYVLGFRFQAGLFPALGSVGLALLFGMAFAWLAVALALRAKAVEAISAGLNVMMLAMSFVSTGFVAADDLPGWAQPFAKYSPVSVTVEAVRALTQGGPTVRPVLKALAWVVGLGVTFALLAVRWAREPRTA